MKNDKMNWYFLIAAALIVGAMVGYFATSNLTTEGNAKAALKSGAIMATEATEYEKYAMNEISTFAEKNNLLQENKRVMIIRPSTDGQLKPTDPADMVVVDLELYTTADVEDEIWVIDKKTKEVVDTIRAVQCTVRFFFNGHGGGDWKHQEKWLFGNSWKNIF